MAEYIEREAAIAYIREQSEECQKAFEELGGESGIYADAYNDLAEDFYSIPAADVAPVVHGRCPICSGRKILTQDCYNDYSVEVDAEQGEMSIWQGDACLTVISIDYCPNCGAKMDGGAGHEAD